MLSTKSWPRCATTLAAIALLVAGCSSNRSVDDKLALEYERAERQASIQAFMSACEQAGRIVFYTGPSRNKLRDPVRNPPPYARLTDYRCEDQTAVGIGLGVGG